MEIKMTSILMKQLSLYDLNSRKTLNKETIQELANSISEVGLINPLTVIPNGNGYQVIAGQRRFEALTLLEVDNAECTIVNDLSEEEILEIQITENMQREDVHPLEELAAINILLRSMTVEEVASKLGKAEVTIRRLKLLNTLAPPVKRLFKNNIITLAHALVFARFPKEVQLDAVENLISEDDEGNAYIEWLPAQLKKEILRMAAAFVIATFDMTDKSLGLDKFGSCTNCKHNTGTNDSLFGDNDQARCTHTDCFDHKVKEDLKRKIESAKKTHSTLVLLDNSYELESDEYLGVKIVLASDYEEVIGDDIKSTDKPALMYRMGYNVSIPTGTFLHVRKKTTPGTKTEIPDDETVLEGKDRKMKTRQERELRKARIKARRTTYDNILNLSIDLTEFFAVKDKLITAIANEGDQKVVRELYDLGEDRIDRHLFPEKMREAEVYPDTVDKLLRFISVVFLSDVLGSKYDNDTINKSDDLFLIAGSLGVDPARSTEVIDEVKKTHKEEKKQLKIEVKVFEDVENMHAERVKSGTPVEISKGNIFRVGDNLPDDLVTLKRIARKFGMKVAKLDEVEDVQKNLLDRFNDLRRR